MDERAAQRRMICRYIKWQMRLRVGRELSRRIARAMVLCHANSFCCCTCTHAASGRAYLLRGAMPRPTRRRWPVGLRQRRMPRSSRMRSVVRAMPASAAAEPAPGGLPRSPQGRRGLGRVHRRPSCHGRRRMWRRALPRPPVLRAHVLHVSGRAARAEPAGLPGAASRGRGRRMPHRCVPRPRGVPRGVHGVPGPSRQYRGQRARGLQRPAPGRRRNGLPQRCLPRPRCVPR